MTTKICTKCNIEKSITKFKITKKKYVRNVCNSCCYEYQQRKPEQIRAQSRRTQEKQKAQRKQNLEMGKFAYWSVRKYDKRNKLTNDLTREFVEKLIKNPCTYCQNTKIKMTLDRIDNTKGHLQSNVVPCCMRCNMIKNNMPYEAWLIIAPAVKLAVEQGKFLNWVGGRLQYSAP